MRVLRALHAMPEGVPASAREVGRRAGVSHPTASNVLSSLVQQGVVSARRSPRADAYVLNDAHVLTSHLRLLFGWEDDLIRDLVGFLRQRIGEASPAVARVFLFGSAVKGTMTESSDIDVAVLCPEEKEEEVEDAMRDVADAVRLRYGNDVRVIVGSEGDVRSRQPGRRRLWERIVRDGLVVLPQGREGSRAQTR